MTSHRRGLGLGTTLIVVSVVATLGLFLASLSVTHINLVSRDLNRAYASDMARRAMALTVAALFQDKLVGTAGHALSFSVPCTDAPDGSEGLATFDPGQAGTWRIPKSTANLTGKGSVSGSNGRVVPLQSVQILAVGRCRGVVRTVECILNVPPYPWAVASDAVIASGGDLQVGASDLSPLPLGVTMDQLQMAGLLSNSAGTSISLGPNCIIQGGMQTVGTTAQDPSCNVTGTIDENHAPEDIPVINVTSLDPSLGGAPVTTLSQAVYTGTTPLTGRLKRSGDVTFDNVTLQGTVLYVDGNMVVNNAVHGTGLVAVAGNLTINGQAVMTASDQVAIVAGGSIALLGHGRNASSLRGIIYSEGGVRVSQLQLEGTIVTHQPAGGAAPNVQLDRASVIAVPDLARFSFPVGLAGVGTAYGGTTCGYVAAYSSGDNILVRMTRLPDGSFAVDGRQNNGAGNMTFSLPFTYQYLQPMEDTLAVDLKGPFDQAPFLDQANPYIATPIGSYVFDPLGVASSQSDPGYSADIFSLDPNQLLPLASSSRMIFFKED